MKDMRIKAKARIWPWLSCSYLIRSRAESWTTFSRCATFRFPVLVSKGILLIRNSPPHKDHHRAIGIFHLKGTRGPLFLMSEVPL